VIEDILIIISNTLIYMVPLLLASTGEIITERSGIVNIGLEGIMVLSAFTAALASFYLSPLTGLILGMIIGLLSGLLHGFISIYLKGDQIIVGIGYNIFSYGLSIMGLIAVWRQHGSSPPVDKIGLIHLYLPIGRVSLSILSIVSILLAILTWHILFHTGLGLRLRACGEDPKSAEALGINVYRMRLYSTMIGGLLTGLAGAYLSVGWIGQFTRDISAGRGFIALANVAFSGWNPLLAIIGAMVFGLFDTLSIYLPIKIQVLYPHARIASLAYLFNTLPYIATLTVVSLAIGRVRMPASLGKPYIKE